METVKTGIINSTTADDNFSVLNVYDPDENPVDRQERIEWWDQKRLRDSRVMVIGTGAVGNETLKNLALLGFGYVFALDFDTVERSNLSRTVLFRREDIGKKKVEVAARRVRELAVNPSFEIEWYHGDVTRDLGPSIYAEMDVVLGCLDNVGARLAIDRNCRLAGIPWIDAGIHELGLSVTFFSPDSLISYESTLSKNELQNAVDRNSCFGFKVQAAKESRVATTQIAATLVSGLQVQEAVKHLCKQNLAIGKRLFFQGMSNSLDSFGYANISETTEPLSPITPNWEVPLPSSCTVRDFLNAVTTTEHSGENCSLEITHTTFVKSFVLETGVEIPVYRPIFTMTQDEVAKIFEDHNAVIGETSYETHTLESIDLTSENNVLDKTIQQLGFPFGPYITVFSPVKDDFDYYTLSLDRASRLCPPQSLRYKFSQIDKAMNDKLTLTFVHPTTGKEITVEISSSMTPSRVIAKLVEANFLKAGDYSLATTGGESILLDSNTALSQQGVASNTALRIVPATQAGITQPI